jgi:lysyl-tRNA synthetase class 2
MESQLFAPKVGEAFLHTSPEFALKRVLASGLPRIYAICPCFRDEEWGPLHTQEFTMVEWYRAGCGYREIQIEVEELFKLAAATLGVDLSPTVVLTHAEAFLRFTGKPAPIDPIESQRTWVNTIEPQLQAPTFIVDYPADEAAFAQVRGGIAERFELFYKGVELANAFTELLDAAELRERWTANNTLRVAEGHAPHPVDERLVAAVGVHPRAGGVALGLDRLLYALLDLRDIRDTQVPG